MGLKAKQTDIKWIRLQEICLNLVDRTCTVHITASTDVPPNYQALVSREGERIDVLMNMLYNKNLADVIDSLAHEMAHIVLDTAGHGPEFNEKWAALRKSITGEYGRLGLLAKARRRAKLHLEGKVDKAGKPKFGHAERVASKLTRTMDKTVAYLHDLLEDTTTYDEKQLKAEFSGRIAEAVLAMTWSDRSEAYMSYIRRLAPNPVARRVKLADLADNMDPNRPIPDAALTRGLKARYTEARKFLLKFKPPKN
jgi:GTP diphosphokinase / guanosine-3',5'-bis(diphosphate) 3'-diphosphatase